MTASDAFTAMQVLRANTSRVLSALPFNVGLASLFFTAMLVQVGKDSVMMIIEPKEATRRQFKRLLHSPLLG